MKNIDEGMLKSMKVAELRTLAAELGVEASDELRKPQLREAILKNIPQETFDARQDETDQTKKSAEFQKTSQKPKPELPKTEAEFKTEKPQKTIEENGTSNPESEEDKPKQQQYTDEERPQVEGILDVVEGGYGFLRFDNYLSSEKDIYVSTTQIKRFNLKTGDKIKCITRHPNDGERFGALLYVNTVNGDPPGVSMHRPNFEDLTPIFPYERLKLETLRTNLSTRLIDIVAPIGRGQRGLIVAPPKTGKTLLLKNIASAIEAKYPDINVIVLLIDERPEEVTDMKRSIKGEIVYSTFDEQAEHHVKVAEMVLARAQRVVEHKKDVVILD